MLVCLNLLKAQVNPLAHSAGTTMTSKLRAHDMRLELLLPLLNTVKAKQKLS